MWIVQSHPYHGQICIFRFSGSSTIDFQASIGFLAFFSLLSKAQPIRHVHKDILRAKGYKDTKRMLHHEGTHVVHNPAYHLVFQGSQLLDFPRLQHRFNINIPATRTSTVYAMRCADNFIVRPTVTIIIFPFTTSIFCDLMAV